MMLGKKITLQDMESVVSKDRLNLVVLFWNCLLRSNFSFALRRSDFFYVVALYIAVVLRIPIYDMKLKPVLVTILEKKKQSMDHIFDHMTHT